MPQNAVAFVIMVDDQAALEAFYLLCKFEGIIPALESSHAVAQAIREAKRQEHRNILINLSGRGDKDVDHVLARTAPREETDANMTRR